MRGYDLIHEVVKGLGEFPPVIRDTMQVQVLTDGGMVVHDIVGVVYDPETNTLMIKTGVTD